jgi:hypothetical protein
MVPKATYFIQRFCDRCDRELSEKRMMSFFTNETICLECFQKEEEIRTKIREESGADADLAYQGCGFVPKVKGEHRLFRVSLKLPIFGF